MAIVDLAAPSRPAADQSVVVRAVTVIMGTVVGLTFLFGTKGCPAMTGTLDR
jgi:hypothetical protein